MNGFIHQQFMKGLSLHQQGKILEAKPIYESVLKAFPQHADAMNLLGVIANQLGNSAQAIQLISKSIQLNPNEVGYRINFANVLRALNQFEAALENINHVIHVNPNIADAHNNRGVILKSMGLHSEALSSYDDAIRLMPNHADFIINRIRTLQVLRKENQGLNEINELIANQPNCSQAYLLRGQLLQSLNRHTEAIQSFDIALQLNLNDSEAFNARGVSYENLRQFDAALVNYEQSISINPNYAGAYINRGNILNKQQRLDESIKSYEAAHRLNPDSDYLHGIILHNRMRLCDWNDFEESVKKIERIKEDQKVIMCIPVLAAVDSLSVHRHVAQTWASGQYPADASLGELSKYSPKDKIRIGYVSSDFRQHPVSQLLAGVIESHNRDRFELFAFSSGPDTQDSLRKRMQKAFDHFIDISQQSDHEVAALARKLEIDIAIDLGGHTRDSRIGVFSCRAAPIQVGYLGYPGTLGAEYMDYLIADQMIIPEGLRHHYAEKIVYLPSYQPNDVTRESTALSMARRDYGLPEQGIVFCCFNEPYKIIPQVFNSWMRILQAVQGSVLWLRRGHPAAVANLKHEAVTRGIDPSRLLFADRVPSITEHLARHRLADLFLDTFPYNAHTTASDALWAGLPVLTRVGDSFASRVAASLLRAIGLPELITETSEAYEALAIALATDPERLTQVKSKLGQNRLTAALFDTKKYTLSLEKAYQAMYDRYQADLPLDHLVIEG